MPHTKKIKAKPTGKRPSRFDCFRPLIRELLEQNQTTNEIEAALRVKGYSGSRGSLNFIVAEERRHETGPVRMFLQKKVLHVLWDKEVIDIKASLQKLHPKIPEEFPELLKLGKFLCSFRQLFKDKQREGLRNWLAGQKDLSFRHLSSFINGIREDIRAVYYAVTLDFSNGPVEGIINKLKNIKRMMYGRANSDLLYRRLILR